MKHFSKLTLTAALLTATSFTPAWALDGNDFAKKLADIIGANGMVIEMGDVATNGDTVTISSINIAPPGEDPITLDKPIVFSGVAENGDGYTAKSAKLEAFTISEDDVEVSVGDIVVEDIILPADGASNPMAGITLYGKFLAGPITAKMEGEQAVSIDSIVGTNVLDGDVLTGTFKMEGLKAEVAKLAEDGMDELAMLQAFGLSTINARFDSTSTWNIKSGDLEISEAKIDVADVGALNITGSVEGYTEDVVEELYKLQKDLVADPDVSPEDVEKQGEQILALMGEKLSIKTMSIRFDDQSITGKVLGMFAAQSGTTPEVMGQGFAASLPVMAAQMGLPEALQGQLAEAATAYLSDPKNLEISIAPSQPVPLMESMMVMFDPETLVSVFNLRIKANQ